MKIVRWDFLFYVLLGAVITLAVRIAGVVVVFAFLIIPATTSALFTASVKRRLIIAWASGAVASLLGVLFAYQLDFSVGPFVALFLGLVLVLAAAWQAWRARGRAAIGGSIVTTGRGSPSTPRGVPEREAAQIAGVLSGTRASR